MVACWARIRGRLRDEVGEVEYRTWLRQMTLHGIDGDEAVILLPTRFLRDWVNSHYGDRLRALWQAEDGAVRRVEIRVAQAAGSAPQGSQQARGSQGAAAEPAYADGAGTLRGDPPGLAESLAAPPRPPELRTPEPRSDWVVPLEARFTFDTFVVGKPNEFAHACARRVAERPASPGFNPLFLYGGVGLGKTHLMHAIAWAIREGDTHRTVAYMSAEKFMYRFIAALRSQSTMEFKETLRAVDVLMIDDLQFLIGKDNTQEEFFHTFNALVDQGKQIVVSSDKPPSDLAGIEDRLRTRLGCGMVADLHATTYELRLSILQAKAAAAQVLVPAKVMELLATKITTNVRELEGALNRLVAHANLFGRPITVDSAHEVLHDVLRAHEKRVSIEEIQRKVAEHYNLRLTDMVSARRAGTSPGRARWRCTWPSS
ncbi:chromosomal replication initiator protein DnaA [Dankookia sp. P2]|uniref:chromosomal replication initiator protein DnaA n=1 Tax=Dankookia sp. P2 TaxID=3423955 RepID=UPI003D664772